MSFDLNALTGTLGTISTKEIILNSSLLTFTIRIMWTIGTESLIRFRQLLMRKPRTYSIPLGPYHTEFEGKVTFSCLLVRYGTDEYIRHMASDTEKYDGRLQNRIIPITVVCQGEGEALFSLRLPVHQRVGTQFKCFAEVKQQETISWLEETLSKCDRIYDISLSSNQFRNRIYFLLRDFGTTESVDGITNNMCFPH